MPSAAALAFPSLGDLATWPNNTARSIIAWESGHNPLSVTAYSKVTLHLLVGRWSTNSVGSYVDTYRCRQNGIVDESGIDQKTSLREHLAIIGMGECVAVENPVETRSRKRRRKSMNHQHPEQRQNPAFQKPLDIRVY